MSTLSQIQLASAQAGYARAFVTCSDNLPNSFGTLFLLSASLGANPTILAILSSGLLQVSFSINGLTIAPNASAQLAIMADATYFVYYIIDGSDITKPTTFYNTIAYAHSAGNALAVQNNLAIGIQIQSSSFTLPLAGGQSALIFPSLLKTPTQLSDTAPATNDFTSSILISVNGAAPVASAIVINTDTIAFVINSNYGEIYSGALQLIINGAYSTFYQKTINAIKVPAAFDINLNRALYEIRAANILVVYRTDQTDSQNLANYYAAARNIPNSNVLSTTPLFGFVFDITTVQLMDFLVQIVAGVKAAGNPIKCILLCGDFPSTVSDWSTGINDDPSFCGALKSPNYYLNNPINNAFLVADTALRSRFWGDNSALCPSQRVQNMGINPYFSPAIIDQDAYGIFTLPLSPFADGLSIAKARIQDCIANEKAGYIDFGTVLLYGGGYSNGSMMPSGNLSNQCVVEEMRYALGTPTPPNVYWAGLNNEYGISPNAAQAIADSDASGWAANQPGFPGFPIGAAKPRDVFLHAPGVRGYYNPPGFLVEQAGDYNYRRGALAMFSQSYGYRPTAVDLIDIYGAIPVITAQAPIAVYGGEDHPAFFRANSLRGLLSTVFMVGWGLTGGPNSGATFEVSGSPLQIICKLSGVAQITVSTSGKTLAQIESDFYTAFLAANGAGSQWVYDPGNTVGRMSRALAAWRAGAAIAAGVSREPFAFGDVDCFGLFTTLWNGGNIAEWAQRAYAQINGSTNVYGTIYNVGWYILGDPLYAPFRQSRVPGAFYLIQ